MHSLHLMLVKAPDRLDAHSKVDKFMEGYGDGQVWDWYSVGGRWSGCLMLHKAEMDNPKGFKKFMDGFEKQKLGWVSGKEGQTEVEQRAKSDKLFMECFPGWTGPIPFYRDNRKHDTSDDDIMPLSEPYVLDYCKMRRANLDKEIKEIRKRAKAAVNKGKWDDWNIHRLNDVRDDYIFSDESTVYDVTEGTWNIPADTKGYWCVVIDSHN